MSLSRRMCRRKDVCHRRDLLHLTDAAVCSPPSQMPSLGWNTASWCCRGGLSGPCCDIMLPSQRSVGCGDLRLVCRIATHAVICRTFPWLQQWLWLLSWRQQRFLHWQQPGCWSSTRLPVLGWAAVRMNCGVRTQHDAMW